MIEETKQIEQILNKSMHILLPEYITNKIL